jgi:hypothetical protein
VESKNRSGKKRTGRPGEKQGRGGEEQPEKRRVK